MRHIKYILAVMAMLILSAVPALAVEGMEASVTGGLEFFSGDFNRAKFNEYNVRREGPWGGFADVNCNYAKPDSNHEYNFNLKYRSLEDIDMCLDTMSYGEYKFFVSYQRMGHEFANDVKSIYSGDGTGRLKISPSTLAEINPVGVFSVTGLQDAVRDAHTIDLFLIRDRVKTGLEWMSIKPLTLYALFDYEHREGDRPYGGTFSTSNAMEIPEPINYDTYNAKAGAEFAGKPIYADVSYNHSTFNNNIQSLTYDNIMVGAGLPTTGRNSLAPSNSFDSVSVVLAKNLPLSTRVVFDFNYGWLRQDEGLLPPTTNAALAPNNTTAVLPRTTADASVNTSTYDVKVTSSPIEKLELKAGYRYYQHDNTTPVASFPNTPNDTNAITIEQPEYMSWITRTANAEASYEVYRRTHVGFAYEHLSEDYTKGSARTESENTFKLFMDSRALDFLTARLTLAHSNRDSKYPNDQDFTTLRKYYQADRDRYLADTLVTITPMDNLSVSLNYDYADTRYEDSTFGLHDIRGHTAGIDTTYQPAWWLGMNVFYTYENQRNRQNDSRSGANWFLKTVDETNTVGAGVDIGIIKDKLNLKVDGSYAKVDGDATFASNTPLLPWDHVDETMLTKICGAFKYKATKALDLTLGYGYEKWSIKDYQYNGVTNVVVTAANAYKGLLTMNSLYKPYEVHSVIATATYRF